MIPGGGVTVSSPTEKRGERLLGEQIFVDGADDLFDLGVVQFTLLEAQSWP